MHSLNRLPNYRKIATLTLDVWLVTRRHILKRVKSLVKRPIRIAFLADSHLGLDYPVRPRIERRRRGDDFFANFRRVLDYARATKPDLVVHGGDLFFRSRVPPKIVDLVYDELLSFAKCGIPLLIVPGNHERSQLPGSLWLAAPNIYVFDQPATLRLPVAGYDLAIAGFPFVRDNIRQAFRNVLEQTGWKTTASDVKLLCMHHAVEGATVGPSNYAFRTGSDVVRMADIPPEFAIVLSGHIHRRQILTGSGKAAKVPIVYAGSIERTSFAEKDEPKGFYEIELAPSTNGSWAANRIDFLPLPARPMIDLTIDQGLHPTDIRHYLSQQIARLDQNAIVRIRGIRDDIVGASVTTSFLRSVFPPTMNVELGASLYCPSVERGDAGE